MLTQVCSEWLKCKGNLETAQTIKGIQNKLIVNK